MISLYRILIKRMKINKKSNINIDTTSNIQNNQRKDSLRGLNQKMKISKNFFSRKFFKDLGIVESVGDGIINILGLQKAANGEMVEICTSEKNQKGLILNLGPK
jgi:F0F1-type ATP synthase alpha subunit